MQTHVFSNSHSPFHTTLTSSLYCVIVVPHEQWAKLKKSIKVLRNVLGHFIPSPPLRSHTRIFSSQMHIPCEELCHSAILPFVFSYSIRSIWKTNEKQSKLYSVRAKIWWICLGSMGCVRTKDTNHLQIACNCCQNNDHLSCPVPHRLPFAYTQFNSVSRCRRHRRRFCAVFCVFCNFNSNKWTKKKMFFFRFSLFLSFSF